VSIALSLLGDVRWRQRPVVGGGRPVPDSELIELARGEEPPVNGLKSLQVLVSRTRTACGADVIARDGAGDHRGDDLVLPAGYRLREGD
jgi:hypothetical protein